MAEEMAEPVVAGVMVEVLEDILELEVRPQAVESQIQQFTPQVRVAHNRAHLYMDHYLLVVVPVEQASVLFTIIDKNMAVISHRMGTDAIITRLVAVVVAVA
jgi:hypothetical protein